MPKLPAAIAASALLLALSVPAFADSTSAPEQQLNAKAPAASTDSPATANVLDDQNASSPATMPQSALTPDVQSNHDDTHHGAGGSNGGHGGGAAGAGGGGGGGAGGSGH